MSRVVNLCLVGLILACPLLCGLVGPEPGAHQQATAEDCSSPSHWPEDDDSCVCRGAVQVDAIRIADPDLLSRPGFLIEPPAMLAIHLLRFSRWGEPSGCMGLADEGAVRAYLQIFRC